MPQGDSDVDYHDWFTPLLGDQQTQFSSGRFALVLQCDHRITNPQPLESCHFNVLLEGKIPNRTGGRRDKRGPGLGKRMLSGRPGLQGEPHVDD